MKTELFLVSTISVIALNFKTFGDLFFPFLIITRNTKKELQLLTWESGC